MLDRAWEAQRELWATVKRLAELVRWPAPRVYLLPEGRR